MSLRKGVESGAGEVILDGGTTEITDGFAIIVPAGAEHNIVNSEKRALKLCTIHSPPNHRDGVLHHTRADALKDDEHFNGKTTETSCATAKVRLGT